MPRFNSFVAAVLLAASLNAVADPSPVSLYQQVEHRAQQGNPEMQYHLGMLLNNGIGVAKDPGQAFVWFERAAKAGDPLAAYKVGCYLAGQFSGTVPRDMEQALKFKLIAAEAGYSLAQYDVGILYFQRKAPEQAMQWWLAAAKQGNRSALYNLAGAYKNGQGAPADTVLAYAYLVLATRTPDVDQAKARAQMDGIKATLTPDETVRFDAFLSSWKSEPTALTLLAAQGLGRTKFLLEQSGPGKQ
jgi:TPR repeat protein